METKTAQWIDSISNDFTLVANLHAAAFRAAQIKHPSRLSIQDFFRSVLQHAENSARQINNNRSALSISLANSDNTLPRVQSLQASLLEKLQVNLFYFNLYFAVANEVLKAISRKQNKTLSFNVDAETRKIAFGSFFYDAYKQIDCDLLKTLQNANFQPHALDIAPELLSRLINSENSKFLDEPPAFNGSKHRPEFLEIMNPAKNKSFSDYLACFYNLQNVCVVGVTEYGYYPYNSEIWNK